MEERFAYLLRPDFDLNAALAGPAAAETLRAAEDLLAGEILAWLQLGREGFPPERFAVWNKALESLKAGRHIVEMLRLSKNA